MAKSLELENRYSVIRGWLESGMRTNAVSTMIQARFSVSRATAYSDIQKVSQTIQESDDGPADEEDCFDPDTVLASLQHQFNIAAAVGDVKSASQLVKSIDTVLKWRGYHTTTNGAMDRVTV